MAPRGESADAQGARRTPRAILWAFALFVIALALPFIGNLVADHDQGSDGFGKLGILFVWTGVAVLVHIAAVLCAISGARRRPRSAATKAAMVLATALSAFILYALIQVF